MFCASGAVERAAISCSKKASYLLFERGNRYLNLALRRRKRSTDAALDHYVAFNDPSATTHKDILSLFDSAIKQAEKELAL